MTARDDPPRQTLAQRIATTGADILWVEEDAENAARFICRALGLDPSMPAAEVARLRPLAAIGQWVTDNGVAFGQHAVEYRTAAVAAGVSTEPPEARDA